LQWSVTASLGEENLAPQKNISNKTEIHYAVNCRHNGAFTLQTHVYVHVEQHVLATLFNGTAFTVSTLCRTCVRVGLTPRICPYFAMEPFKLETHVDAHLAAHFAFSHSGNVIPSLHLLNIDDATQLV